MQRRTVPKAAIDDFKRRWGSCTLCPLHETVDKYVLFDAPTGLPCDVLFIGEAPGHSEDATGVPFIGVSGQLLRGMISQIATALGRSTPTWAITNTVCCIPLKAGSVDQDDDAGGIRPPNDTELVACQGRLSEFLGFAQPRLVVLLGNPAKKNWGMLLTAVEKRFKNNARLWASDWWVHNVPTLELRHPAYVLRQGGPSSLEYKRCLTQLKDAFKTVISKKRKKASS